MADDLADCPEPARARLQALRRLILETAAATEGVGPLEETLRWGQASYLTTASGSGSMIRIDQLKDDPGAVALYVHCQTSLIADFREHYPDRFSFEGSRAVVFGAAEPIDTPELRHCVAMALTYQLRKRARKPARGGR